MEVDDNTFSFVKAEVMEILMTSDETDINGKTFFMNYHGASYTDVFSSDASANAEDATMEEKIIVILTTDLGSSGLDPSKGIGQFAENNPIGEVPKFFKNNHWM